MKRYRVWQANREVFLWPENWLYPELRDDQSPFFQQMMSSLLQGDITDDAAASAYLDYLTSLEEVAKLEPCGLYYQPGARRHGRDLPTSWRGPRARTASTTSASCTDGAWTPWTQVHDRLRGHAGHAGRLERPAVPVLAQGRQAEPSQPRPRSPPTSGDRTLGGHAGQRSDSFTAAAASNAQPEVVTVQAVLCWTEFYNGKWQPTKTSDVNLPTTLGPVRHRRPGRIRELRGL